jgi:TolB-like protein
MFEWISPRRLPGLAIVCSLLALTTVAVAPSPSPMPAPTSAPAGIEQMPVVMVYPFDVQTGADQRIGAAIAQILAQEMIAAGGISVPAVPQHVKRADFLETARAAHADFYISGYVTPVGDSAAVVEQVVSVASGVILFSQTAQVSSVADVASQSLLARTQILTFVGRETQNVQTQSSNTPAPSSTNGANVPISGLSNIVNSVFKRKGARTPTPAPVPKPSRGVIVAPVSPTGSVAPADLTDALHELYFALGVHYNVQLTGVTSTPSHSTDAICGPNRDNTVATGTLQEVPARRGKTITFKLFIYTCFGAPLDSQVGTGGSIKSAVDAAVAAYAKAHPDNG